ncbi:hypothetical protein CEXT_184091 [Caerostris extrusa]|uniref:Uncharacterized protein n=1 Tax=Caerostris extrusa TaxID=172846 RepID=A0AAV4UAZ2_CAEEX|nr:hypothetical protein CEXT_184091 [Caerostris extrusa]
MDNKIVFSRSYWLTSASIQSRKWFQRDGVSSHLSTDDLCQELFGCQVGKPLDTSCWTSSLATMITTRVTRFSREDILETSCDIPLIPNKISATDCVLLHKILCTYLRF